MLKFLQQKEENVSLYRVLTCKCLASEISLIYCFSVEEQARQFEFHATLPLR